MLDESGRPKRQKTCQEDGSHLAWRKRVQGMLLQVDRLLAAPAPPEDQRRWMAQRRELVDLLDPQMSHEIVWCDAVPLFIVP